MRLASIQVGQQQVAAVVFANNSAQNAKDRDDRRGGRAPLLRGHVFGDVGRDGGGLHLFSAVPNLAEWCDLFGLLLLADDVVEAPLQFRNFRVWLPKGPGLEAALDEEKMDHYGRASS